MRKISALVLAICIVLESTFFPFPVPLLWIVFLTCILDEETAIWAFFAGVALDLFALRTLGTSSLFFLAIVASYSRFKQKFHQGWVFYQLGVVIGIIALYSYYFYRYVNPWELVSASVAAVLILFWFKNFFPKNLDKNKLTV